MPGLGDLLVILAFVLVLLVMDQNTKLKERQKVRERINIYDHRKRT